MSTLSLLTTAEAALQKATVEHTSLKAQHTAANNALGALHAESRACKTERCRKKIDGPQAEAVTKVQVLWNQVVGKQTQINALASQIKVLKEQVKVDQSNSEVVTATLAQQGKTIESVEAVAEAESEAQAQVIVSEARTAADIAVSNAAQDNADADKNKNMIMVIVAVVVLVALYFGYTKFIKK